MKEIRCSNCNRLLCKIAFGHVELQCPNSRCKTKKTVKMISAKHLRLLTAEQEQAILKS